MVLSSGVGVALFALGCIFIARIFLILRKSEVPKVGRRGPASVLVVLGSGGHTTEILRLMDSLSASYAPRHYVIANTDRMSEEKVRILEASRTKGNTDPQHTIHWIPRSREVCQSWTSSVISTVYSLLYSIPLVFQLKPDVKKERYTVKSKDQHVISLEVDTCHLRVLCNGPGTCVPLCVSALLLGILGMKKVLIIYVESICRVETLSLSGKILYNLSDYFFVQWSVLQKKYPKAIYLGRLV
ncbi:UDP-N-acetylglucosamine transferase subunit ALG14 homolog isoform X1 [Rhincodon typus]|uniref:UDP-N-acetylglucosamine transferase subunit ALG14 homolog isoform X1 n=1 Tax=Rhincodon typus TaxID=259920 RepID=UPI0020309EFF|nr:UDP-N-acetylglucosamine transferase subunit ALG14 homolog isoform X1 [Rhincodon typus]